MASRINWTESALADLEGVRNNIFRDSPSYAAAFVREIRDASRSLAHFPLRGRMVPEVHDGAIRELLVQNYRLIYLIVENDVYIIALVHGARDLAALWKNKET